MIFALGIFGAVVSLFIGLGFMLAAGSSNTYPKAYDTIIYVCILSFCASVVAIILGVVG